MPIRLATHSPGFGAAFAAFLIAKRGVEDADRAVAEIIADARGRGGTAPRGSPRSELRH